MGFVGIVLNGIGALLLTHAVYSTHEHTTTFQATPLPLDISLELLFSIILLSIGTVVSFDTLKSIQHAEWSGQLSRTGRHGEGQYTREGEELLSEGDPYAFLGLDSGIGGQGEGRKGFWDVRSKRKEYEEWVRSGAR